MPLQVQNITSIWSSERPIPILGIGIGRYLGFFWYRYRYRFSSIGRLTDTQLFCFEFGAFSKANTAQFRTSRCIFRPTSISCHFRAFVLNSIYRNRAQQRYQRPAAKRRAAESGAAADV